MKILFDHQIFCKQEYGGISKYFYEIAKEYLKHPEIDLNIFSPLFINKYISNLPKQTLSGYGVNRIPILFGPYFISIFNNLLSTLGSRKYIDVDIVHETYFSAQNCLPIPAKRVITIYDMIHEKFPELYPNNSFSLTKIKAIKRADHIICISNNTQKDLIDLFSIHETKLSVIYLGRPASINPFIERNLSSPQPSILFVGKRNEYKNFNRFVQSIANNSKIINSYKIVCFGGGDFTLTEKQMFQDLGFTQDNIEFVDGNDNLLSRYYSNASLFVFPSLYEGFGLPLLEAMMHGCPVACSNTSSFPEVVGDAAEKFDPQSEDEMIVALEKVLFNPERAQELIKNGYQRVKLFSWEKCANETLSLYERIVQ